MLPKNPDKDKEVAKKVKEEYYFKKLVTESSPEVNTTSMADLESNRIEENSFKNEVKPSKVPDTTKNDYEIMIVEGEEFIQLPDQKTTINYPSVQKKPSESDGDFIKRIKATLFTKNNEIDKNTVNSKNSTNLDGSHLLVAPVNKTQVQNVLEEYRAMDGHQNGYQVVAVRKDDAETLNYFRNLRIKPKKQLLQGFVMTPGYPKFYIGTGYCKWSINITEGKRIRITIMDLNVRRECYLIIYFCMNN